MGRGRWREQDVILSLARLQRQAGTGEGERSCRVRGAVSALLSLPAVQLTWCTAALGGGSPGKAEGWRRQCGESLLPHSLPNSVCRFQAGQVFHGAGMMV